jgi:hypothetical protein
MTPTKTGSDNASDGHDDAATPPSASATADEVTGSQPPLTSQSGSSTEPPPPVPPAPSPPQPPAPPAPPPTTGRKWRLTTGKAIAIVATLLVVAGLISIVTFTLQVYPFRADRVEACELVDDVSDKLGKVDAATAIKDYNKYLADRDMRKVMLICDIERASVWYGRVSVTNQILLSIGTVLVVVLTLTTSFILGAGWVEKTPSLKPVTVALPLISAAITATISEFHLSDVWQLREIGKIESRLMLNGLYDLGTDHPEFDTKLQEIKVGLAGLEKNQAERYFAYKFQTVTNKIGDTPEKPPTTTDGAPTPQ